MTPTAEHGTPSAYAGKLADPEFRRERARKAGKASQSLDTHVKAVVDRAPELSAAQRGDLAQILGLRDATPEAVAHAS